MADADQVRQAARAALEQLQGRASPAEVQAAKLLVEKLRDQRDHELMGQLAACTRST